MASKKVRQRICYVLEIDAQSEGHRLGVNGLAVDDENSILYSGGRDGVVCAWDLHLDPPKRDVDDDDNDNEDEEDDVESSTIRNNGRITNGHKPAKKTTIRHQGQTATSRAQTQAHTHWINDITLAQNNTALVTASSDLLVKVWRPRADDNDSEPAILGQHADYVKCVASPSKQATWVASGGLDRHICLWDLNGGGSTLEIDVSGEENTEKGSVYALRATHSILASGGPESTVRLWDPRTGENITKFVGHTDNVRAILVNEAGDTVMTASSDSTVKIWSVTAGRCMHTLTMHNDSVWSLYSQCPDLALFYSSDRSGLVVKTDIRASLDERSSLDDINAGVSVAVAQEHGGVSKIIASNGYIWTATASSSINRWADVNTTNFVLPEPPRPFSPVETIRPHSSSVSSVTADGGPNSAAAAAATAAPAASAAVATGPSQQASEIPVKSILRIYNTSSFPAPLAGDAVSLSTTSLPAAAAAAVAASGAIGDDATLPAIEPVHRLPVETIEGNFGLVKHRLLNDRRRVLTLDTAGEVLLWDLINCKQIRNFGKRHLEDVEPEVNTTEVVWPWCSVDVSSGNLMVVLEQYNCFDAEMYADELVLDEPVAFEEDQRINLGKWILRYLFAGLINEEIGRDNSYRAKINEAVEKRLQAAAAANPVAEGAEGGAAEARPSTSLLIPVDKRASQASRPSQERDDRALNGISPIETNGGSAMGSKPAGAATAQPAAPETAAVADTSKDKDSSAKSPGTPFGKKFRMGMSFGSKKLGRSASTSVADKPAGPSADEKVEEQQSESASSHEKEVDDCFGGVIQRVHHEYDKQATDQPEQLVETRLRPCQADEAPELHLPANIKLIIQEELRGGSIELYRGTIASVGQPRDVDKIEKCAPMWLGEALLVNNAAPKEAMKLSFLLLPYRDALPPITSSDGSSRLNANRMLRVKKILAYVADKIDPPAAAPASADNGDEDPAPAEAVDKDEEETLKAEDYLELYCNEQRLPNSMSLATVRAHIWKNSNDIVLYYKANGRKALPTTRPVKAEAESTAPEAGEQAQTGPGVAASVPVAAAA